MKVADIKPLKTYLSATPFMHFSPLSHHTCARGIFIHYEHLTWYSSYPLSWWTCHWEYYRDPSTNWPHTNYPPNNMIARTHRPKTRKLIFLLCFGSGTLLLPLINYYFSKIKARNAPTTCRLLSTSVNIYKIRQIFSLLISVNNVSESFHET